MRTFVFLCKFDLTGIQTWPERESRMNAERGRGRTANGPRACTPASKLGPFGGPCCPCNPASLSLSGVASHRAVHTRELQVLGRRARPSAGRAAGYIPGGRLATSLSQKKKLAGTPDPTRPTTPPACGAASLPPAQTFGSCWEKKG